jgi:hypothetical protein
MSSQASHQTPDSYDAYTIPPETAARKNRQGNRSKQIPKNPESAGSPLMANPIIDTFPSLTEAESVVLAIQKAGLDTRKILIIGGKDYQDNHYVDRALDWQDIEQASGVAAILVGLGISRNEALKHETEIRAGKFMVLVMGSDEDISQIYQILHNIGRKISEAIPLEIFNSITTL